MARGKINIPMVFRVMGWLLIIESLFMLIPLATTLIYHETDMYPFLWGILITLGAGLGLTFGLRPTHHDMSKREGFLLTALVWIMFSLFGMIPFILSDNPMNVSDAFFEAMSGFTTTGASVAASINQLSHGAVVWRCLMQWIGGMGIILFTLAVVPMLNHSGGMQMFNAEVTGITHDKIRPRISQTAKGLWGLYTALTLLLVVLLWCGPMNFYESLCHAFSTISTGGFSTSDLSIEGFNSVYTKIVIIAFMFLGGTSFALMCKALSGDHKSLFQNDVFKTYLQMIAVCYLIIVVTTLLTSDHLTVLSLTVDPLFQIISTITSTGLTVCHYDGWGQFILSILFVLMFFGACAGSTSGGAKIDRMIYLVKYLSNEVRRSLHPNAMLSVRINGKVMPEDTVGKVIAFLCLYVCIIFLGGLALTAVGLPIVDAFFSSFSCLSNTGLDAGVTGYGNNYASVPDVAKWILSALMLIGRLEIFTILILFTRTFWRR